jgi:hypothetical protein
MLRDAHRATIIASEDAMSVEKRQCLNERTDCGLLASFMFNHSLDT